MHTLNKDTFNLFVIKFHKSEFLTNEIIENDLKNVSYIKKLIQTYHNKGNLNVGLLLNYILIVYNIWGDAAFPILIFKIPRENLTYLKTILIFLNKWPLDQSEDLVNIPVNEKLLEILKKC